MHARNTCTHQDTSGKRSERTHFLSAHHAQGNDRSENGRKQRQQNGRPMVGHGNRQEERQHPNVVHGPNASSHRSGPAQQPNRASPTRRGRYATCQIQSSVRRKHGDQHRKRHERVVVRAYQVHGSHVTPSAYHAEFAPRFNQKLPVSLALAPILPGSNERSRTSSGVSIWGST